MAEKLCQLKKKGGSSEEAPTEGIYAAYGSLSAGYYANNISLTGWDSSTSLIFNKQGGNTILMGITSCEVDGTPVTVTSNQCQPTITNNVDHIITFTVASGKSPTVSVNSSQGYKVTKAIFNK